MKRTYTNRRELEIDLFFKYVNWYKLLKKWGLYPTFAKATDTIFEYKQKTESIRKVWKNHPNQTLPQILAVMGILPLKHVRRGTDNAQWYFSTINNLMEDMNIPRDLYTIERKDTWIFNIKRKNPIYKVKK